MIHPGEASARGIAGGDAERVFNALGACYLGACLSDGIRPGVIRIKSGAWVDPEEPGAYTVCKYGNPNMLDKGRSDFTQRPIANPCLVVAGNADDPHPVAAFEPPEIIRRRP